MQSLQNCLATLAKICRIKELDPPPIQTWFKLQVNFFQKHLFLHQLTHSMTKDWSLNYEFSTWKLQAQNMLFTQIVLNVKTKTKTICVHNMFSWFSELVVFKYWTGNSMDNLLSYCGLVFARKSTSEKVYLYIIIFLLKIFTFLITPKNQ